MNAMVMTVFFLISDFKENSPKSSPCNGVGYISFIIVLSEIKKKSFYLEISEYSYCDNMLHHYRLSLGHRK